MKKNVQFQLRIESEVLEKLRQQAKDAGITISEECRQKIDSPPQLLRIELKIDKIEREIFKINNN